MSAFDLDDVNTVETPRIRVAVVCDYAITRLGYTLIIEPPRVYRRLFGLSHAAWRSELMG